MTYPQQPPYPVVIVQKPPMNGAAVTGMVCGIIAIVVGIWAFVPLLGLVAWFLALLPTLLAIVGGHVGSSRAKAMHGAGQGQATTALVLGYITLGILVLTTLIFVLAMAAG